MKSKNHWSKYWASGNLTSLPQDFKTNYDGQLQEFWNSQFSLLDNQARVLDLCCGNGALALLALSYSTKTDKKLVVEALDAAKICLDVSKNYYPNLTKHIDQIKVHSNTPIEEYSGEGNSFDLIVSQYGIEYCDWEVTAEKVKNLLSKNGRLAFVAHAVDSKIMKVMNEEKHEYDFLVKMGLIENIRANKHSKLQGLSLESTQYFSQTLERDVRTRTSVLLSSVYKAMKQLAALDAETFSAYSNNIKTYREELEFGLARLCDLIEMSEKLSNSPNWYAYFIKAGLKLIQKGEVVHDRHMAGNYFVFENY